MSNELLASWNAVMRQAPDLGRGLLARWDEPHRDYHGRVHLEHGLAALEHLGAGWLEVVAWWFHDAVHSNTTPSDELASAVLARESLEGLLAPEDVEEVARLVLLTINHDPKPGDEVGERFCDADLSMIATDPATYDQTVQRLRNEHQSLPGPVWEKSRIAFTGTMLNRPRLFHTEVGRASWEGAARANLERERTQLLSGEDQR